MAFLNVLHRQFVSVQQEWNVRLLPVIPAMVALRRQHRNVQSVAFSTSGVAGSL